MISRERDSDLVVGDLMTLEPVVVQVTAGIEEAEALMHDRAVSGLPSSANWWGSSAGPMSWRTGPSRCRPSSVDARAGCGSES